jgi:drug/metabolite transporter (DMT)-like permease
MIIAGIAVALAAAVMNAWAVVLQAIEAHAQSERSAMRGALLVRLAHRPRWLAGTALMITAGGCQVAALALAPISVVQPVLASSQLVLLGIARLRLREHVGARELLAVGAIVAGVVAVVLVAPSRVTRQVSAGALAAPLASIGGAALLVYLLGRAHPRARLGLVIGAGLAYSWADFVNKLLADSLSGAHWLSAVGWAGAVLCFGAIAFLEETTALQRRPAVAVAPVIGAMKVPLPVLMALWAGLQDWGSGPARIVPLLTGLALTAAGAASLAGCGAVAQVAAAPSTRTARTIGAGARPLADGASGPGASDAGAPGSGASDPGASDPGASDPGASDPGAPGPDTSVPGASGADASAIGASKVKGSAAAAQMDGAMGAAGRPRMSGSIE